MPNAARPPFPSAKPLAARAWAPRVALLAAALLLGCASQIPRGRAAIDSVELEGSEKVSAGDVTDRIATASSPRFLGLFQGVVVDYEIFDPFVFQRDLERVERFYRARGYYQARARAGRVTYAKADHVKVTIVVDEGEPVRVSRVDVTGVEGLPASIVAAALRAARKDLREGALLDEDELKKADSAVKKALGDRGYAHVKVARHATVDLPHHAAVATFAVVPGRPAKLGAITITGLGVLPEAPVRRALDLQPGEPYSTSRLDEAQQAALDLGVFGAVDVQPDLHDPNAEVVPVTVHVEPTLLHSLRLGGGVELDVIKTDVHLRAGWEDLNFLGGMRDFSVDFRPGTVIFPTRLPDFQPPQRLLPEERLHLQLSQPGFIEARAHGILRADANVYPVILTPDYSPSDPVLGYRELRGAAGVDRTFGKLYAALTYNAQLEDPFSYLGPLDPTLKPLVLSYLDLQIHFDFRNDKIHPHSGIYLGNQVQVAGGPFFGEATDVREQPEVRGYIPLGRKVTLAMRGSVGFLFPLDYGDTLKTDTAAGVVPPGVDKEAWERDVQIVYFRSFFAGGPSSDRGWPLLGIGPHGIAPFFNPTLQAQQIANQCTPGSPLFDAVRCSVPLGGLSLWEASAEVRFWLSKALEASTFCDAADVSQRELDVRLQRPHLSCGVGLAYDTPVGPIRLDVAYRIPGLQSLEPEQPGDDANPGTIFGVPLALAIGIGEAY